MSTKIRLEQIEPITGFLQSANNLSDVASILQAQQNLNLEVGVDVQAWDSDLDILATGVLAGGTTGQVLTKDTGTDYDFSWQTPSTGSSVSFGTDNQIPFTNAGGTDFDYSSDFQFTSGGLIANGTYAKFNTVNHLIELTQETNYVAPLKFTNTSAQFPYEYHISFPEADFRGNAGNFAIEPNFGVQISKYGNPLTTVINTTGTSSIITDGVSELKGAYIGGDAGHGAGVAISLNGAHNTTDYTLLGLAGSVYINAKSGGSVIFRENNVSTGWEFQGPTLRNFSGIAAAQVPFWIQTTAAANWGAIIQGSASQTGNLLEFRNSSNSLISAFNGNGYLGIGAAPSYPLDVTGDVNTSGSYNWKYTASNNNMRFGFDTTNSLWSIQTRKDWESYDRGIIEWGAVAVNSPLLSLGYNTILNAIGNVQQQIGGVTLTSLTATTFTLEGTVNMGLGTSYSPSYKLDVGGDFRTTSNSYLATSSGNVGIGATSASYKLDVAGTVNMTGFRLPTSPTAGYVLTSDASGVGTWQAPVANTNFAITNLTATGNRSHDFTGYNLQIDNIETLTLRSEPVGYNSFSRILANGAFDGSIGVTIESSDEEGISTSFIKVLSGSIEITPSTDVLYIKNLNNLTDQNRLIGQYGINEQIGYVTIGSGLSLSSGVLSTTGGGGISDGDKGDITVSGTGTTWTIDNDVVTYAKMQNVSNTNRFLGRITAGSGDTEELTGTQATTLLDNFTSGLKGLAPASGGGTANFLRADGTWTIPLVALSDINAATTTKTINSVDNRIEWQWDSLTHNSGMKFTSAATTGSTGGQNILLQSSMNGAFSTSNVSSIAGYFVNTHTGTGSTNTGVYASASSGGTNYGIQAIGAGGAYGTSAGASILALGRMTLQGQLDLPGSTSGTVSIKTPAIAGTWTWTIPTTSGTSNQVLKTDGAGVTSWGDNTGYTINVQALTSSPTDAQTIYFGTLPKAPTTTAAISKIYIRKSGTLKIAEIYCYSGTAGTNESWSLYVRHNNTTDYLISTLSVSTNERVFSNTGLSIAVAAGDYVEIKSINPTWATNPLTTIFGGYIYIE